MATDATAAPPFCHENFKWQWCHTVQYHPQLQCGSGNAVPWPGKGDMGYAMHMFGIYQQVVAWSLPNFRGARIPLPTK